MCVVYIYIYLRVKHAAHNSHVLCVNPGETSQHKLMARDLRHVDGFYFSARATPLCGNIVPDSVVSFDLDTYVREQLKQTKYHE